VAREAMMPMKTVAWRPAAEDLMPSAEPHFQVLVSPQSVLESTNLITEIEFANVDLTLSTCAELLQEQAGRHIHSFLTYSQIGRLSDTPSTHAEYAVLSVAEQPATWRLVSAFVFVFASASASAAWRFTSAFASVIGSAPVKTDEAIKRSKSRQ